jgi:hypothetical protein
MYCFGRVRHASLVQRSRNQLLGGQAIRYIFSSFLRKGYRSYPSRGSTHQRMGVWKYACYLIATGVFHTPLLRALARHSFRHYSASLRAKPKAPVIFLVLFNKASGIPVRTYFVSLLETYYLIAHFFLFFSSSTRAKHHLVTF